MPAKTFNKFNSFIAAVYNGTHNLSTAVIKVALCDAAHAPVATNSVLADLTKITPTNLSALTVTTVSSSQASGLYKLILADLLLTSSTGDVAPFRYVVLYNDSATNKELIGWYDHGVEITLRGANSDTFNIDFDGTNGVIQDT